MNSGTVSEIKDSNDVADGKPSPFTGCNLDVLGASDDKYVNTRHPDALTAVFWEVTLTTAVKVKTALLINDKWSYDNTDVSYKISIGEIPDYT